MFRPDDGRRVSGRALLLAAVLAAVTASGRSQVASMPQAGALRYDIEYPAIGYSTMPTSDRIADLRRRIAAGSVRLNQAGRRGYLDSLLSALDIDVSSQMLVYSRTSLQVGRIAAETPRAIYYNDDTYVAWVQEADALEIASMDPALGPVFYTLDQNAAGEVRFERELGRCLQCHDSYSLTGGGVPRFITGSGYTDAAGNLVSHEAWILTSDQTPLRSRWGGWYVSGRHGRQVHLGNIIVRDPASLQQLDRLRIGNLDDLDSVFDATAYPARTSDIVALMVLEHQTRVQNAITQVSYRTRTARDEASRGAGPALTADRIAALTEPLVEAVFLVGETTLTDRITGTSGFAAEFEARGPRDGRGRSLRDLELGTRLFRYPMSYLIYSSAFDALPDEIRRQVYRRIGAVLRGEDETGRFDRLSADDRAAILEILSETKPEFAAEAGS